MDNIKKKLLDLMIDKFDDVFELIYLDVGSAGGLNEVWDYLIKTNFMKAVLIDIQDDGLGQLYPKERVKRVQVALGGHTTQQKVYLTKGRWCSSCLIPDMEVLNEYPVKEWFEVNEEKTINMTRYDHVSMEKGLPHPHFVKIDVKGYEIQVLEGMGKVLDSVLCLEHETHLRPIYKGQADFNKIYKFLFDKGFRLYDLKPTGVFEGEALEFDAFWIRKTDDPQEIALIEIWKVANDIWTGMYFNDLSFLKTS
ncbi:FkbM family methyltransferase [Flagellimonas onchidii]|uniref:FkbM family methyltransferase n=1 Tax=Flagellimonas onchidii TaxID=2562684 RepID=UPI0010A5BC18|nr:FkbM family methyltransferase [Allomuricauda onchidii]